MAQTQPQLCKTYDFLANAEACTQKINDPRGNPYEHEKDPNYNCNYYKYKGTDGNIYACRNNMSYGLGIKGKCRPEDSSGKKKQVSGKCGNKVMENMYEIFKARRNSKGAPGRLIQDELWENANHDNKTNEEVKRIRELDITMSTPPPPPVGRPPGLATNTLAPIARHLRGPLPSFEPSRQLPNSRGPILSGYDRPTLWSGPPEPTVDPAREEEEYDEQDYYKRNKRASILSPEGTDTGGGRCFKIGRSRRFKRSKVRKRNHSQKRTRGSRASFKRRNKGRGRTLRKRSKVQRSKRR